MIIAKIIQKILYSEFVAIFINALWCAHPLARIDDIYFGTKNRMLGNEGQTHAATKIETERCGVDGAHLHGRKRWTQNQSTAKTVCLQRRCRQQQSKNQDDMSFRESQDLSHKFGCQNTVSAIDLQEINT